ncbi:FUSC family protein [Sphingobium lactosutens]|uniref:FUSC family protein n=1 Tax=Sphingobium lactosutens TaxID=522773 RepID=UPI0021185F57|nr:FUSC family protein [Sphingobium lactosutens]
MASGAKLLDRVTPRTVDEAECVASVLLAILIAHLLGATHVSWAAFAGYMVMRGHAAETLMRGALRIVGTAAGGLLALGVAPLVLPGWPFAALAMMLVGTISLYAAITSRRSYAWLFFGLTFAMVVLDKLEHPAIALADFVQTRILETVAGIAACLAVSIASTFSLRRRWPAPPTPPPMSARWHRDAFRHACQAGVALALLVALGAAFRLPALAQGAIMVMAVMVLPMTGIGQSGLVPVSRRILQRSIGCGIGALFAAAFLLGAGGSSVLLLTGTAIGVALGRHLENGDPAHRYVGTQFTLAVLVTLVPDRYDAAELAPALERLVAIFVGMGVLLPVLLAGHALGVRRPVTPVAAAQDEAGGV